MVIYLVEIPNNTIEYYVIWQGTYSVINTTIYAPLYLSVWSSTYGYSMVQAIKTCGLFDFIIGSYSGYVICQKIHYLI